MKISLHGDSYLFHRETKSVFNNIQRFSCRFQMSIQCYEWTLQNNFQKYCISKEKEENTEEREDIVRF